MTATSTGVFISIPKSFVVVVQPIVDAANSSNGAIHSTFPSPIFPSAKAFPVAPASKNKILADIKAPAIAPTVTVLFFNPSSPFLFQPMHLEVKKEQE